MRFIGSVIEKLQRHPKRVVFPEGEEPRILQAARQFYALRLGAPIVLGDPEKVKAIAEGLNIPLEGIRVITPLFKPYCSILLRPPSQLLCLWRQILPPRCN